MTDFKYDSMAARRAYAETATDAPRLWDEATRREVPDVILPKLPARRTQLADNAGAVTVFRVTLQEGLAEAAFDKAFDTKYPGLAERLPDDPRAAFEMGRQYQQALDR